MKWCPLCGSSRGDGDTGLCSGCGKRIDTEVFPGRLLDLCRAIHAEEAAILQAARLGSVSLKGSTLYTTTFPCLLCSKMIINAGITHVIYHEAYPMPESIEMLRQGGVTMKKFEGVNSRAFYKLFKEY